VRTQPAIRSALATLAAATLPAGEAAARPERATADPSPTPEAAASRARKSPRVRWLRLPAKPVSGRLSRRRCAVRATDDVRVAQVIFRLDGRVITVNRRRPWTCRLDTRTVPDGRHHISATARDSRGRSDTARRTIRVRNGIAAGAPDASAAPDATADAPPAAPAPSGPRPLFFADVKSVWSTPFSAFGRPVPLRSDNSVQQRELVRMKQRSMGVEQESWTIPTYIVRSDRVLLSPTGEVLERNLPMRRLRVGDKTADPRKGSNDSSAVLNFLLQHGIDGQGWPLPNWARGDPGEGHFALYVQDTGQYAEVYGAQPGANGELRGSWGGYIHDLRRNDGRYKDNFVRSLEWSRRVWGSAGASVPTAGGLIWEAEIRAAMAAWERGEHDEALIPHALGLKIHAHTKNTWVWPASRTDWTQEYGKGGNPLEEGPIEMGQVIKFPDSLDPRSFTRADPRETALLQIIIRTGQRHGFVVWDQTGGGFKLRGEQVRTAAGISTSMFDYGNTEKWMQALPLDKAEFVETREWMPSYYRP